MGKHNESRYAERYNTQSLDQADNPTNGAVCVIPTATPQGLFGEGTLPDVNTTAYLTTISTTNTASTTVTAAADAGTIKRIQMMLDSGTCTVSFAGDGLSLASFADAGDVLEIVWSGTGWVKMASYNLVSGDVGPEPL